MQEQERLWEQIGLQTLQTRKLKRQKKIHDRQRNATNIYDTVN